MATVIWPKVMQLQKRLALHLIDTLRNAHAIIPQYANAEAK